MGRIAEYKKRQKDPPGAFGLRVENWSDEWRPPLENGGPAPTRVMVYPDPPAVARLQDRITWPYSPASVQQQVYNGWNGNQLPGIRKRPWGENVSREWWLTSTQVQNHRQKGEFGRQLSQKASQDILRNIGQMWANVRNGGV